MPEDYRLIERPGMLEGEEPSRDRLEGEAREIVQQLQGEFKDRDNLYKRIDDTVFGVRRPRIPKGYERSATPVHAPFALHVTSTITAAMSINPFTVQFTPIGGGYVHEKNATLREHFFEASWRRQEQEARTRLFRLFMNALVTKGEGVLKTVERTKRAWSGYSEKSLKLRAELDENRYLDEDSKRRIYDAKTEEMKRVAPYPIATIDVAPETFYYGKGEDGFSVCAEVKKVPFYDTLVRFGAGLDGKGRVVPREAMGLPQAQWTEAMGKARLLTMIELWRWDRCIYVLYGPGQVGANRKLAGGTIVETFKHGYGDPTTRTLRGPYFHALGITTHSRLPHRSGLSVLYGYLDVFDMIDDALTMRGNSAFLTGYAAFKEKYPEGGLPGARRRDPYGEDGTAGDGERVTIEPGEVLPYDVEPIEQPRAGVDLDKFLADLRGLVELALPSIVQGVISGDESGYALNQAAHLARLAWDPIVDNAEFALSDRVAFESWLIENKVQERVYAWGRLADGKRRKGPQAGWLGIGPDDLKGVHNYVCRLDPETPANKVTLLRYHEQMVSARFESPEDAINALGGNPDEVERAWLAFDLKQDEEIKAKLRQRVLEKIGALEAQKVARADDVLAELDAAAAPPAFDALGSIGQVYEPGYGMAETPTPQGSVTGVGPAGRALAAGNPAGMPVTPNVPAAHVPLPGQG